MPISKLIGAYKNKRKQGFLDLVSDYKYKYAFVGVGSHSIINLYTAIDYLRVPLKYIVTRSENNSTKMAIRYKAEGTTDLKKVLNDPEVKGVFVCSNPTVHFELCKQILDAGKELFVEKPPCMNLKELNELIALSKGRITVVGLQKRYGSANKILKSHLSGKCSYNYTYGLGLYPEGSELLDLFIHAIDNVVYLFGKVRSVQKNVVNLGSGDKTYHVLIEHENGTTGNLELSSSYTWNGGVDNLVVKTDKKVFRVDYPNYVEAESKSKSFAGVPMEKVFGSATQKEILFHNNGKQPIMVQNEVYVQGFFSEIEAFVNACEGRKQDILSAMEDVSATYKLIEEIEV